MASVQRLIIQGARGFAEYVALQLSTGISSAGQIPALGPLGTLDSSTLPLATSALAMAGVSTTTLMTPALTQGALIAMLNAVAPSLPTTSGKDAGVSPRLWLNVDTFSFS